MQSTRKLVTAAAVVILISGSPAAAQPGGPSPLAPGAGLLPATTSTAGDSRSERSEVQQVAPQGQQDQSDADRAQQDETEDIIVTGTRVRRSGFDTPGSVASFGGYRLRQFMAGSGSQADILQNLPGVNAEGGGGEVATNFRVRGLPSGGQFEFTPLQMDGVSVFSTFGLNSSAFDFFMRADLGIDRLEFNKGGVANLFGAGGQAGVLNYVSKTGGERNEGALQLEYAEGNRFRGDVAVSGPISENAFYAFSGFYRYDEGPLDTGLPTEGFSMRGNVRYEFDDGSGYVQLSGAYLNDRAQFYLPVVLDGKAESVSRATTATRSTRSTRATSRASPRVLPEGITSFDAGNGFRTVGGHVYATLEKDFGDGWKLGSRIKFSVLDTGSNFFNNGAGAGGGGPFTQSQFLDSRGLNGMGAAAFTFAETGVALGPNDLVFANQFNDRERDATDGTIEINVSKQFELLRDVAHLYPRHLHRAGRGRQRSAQCAVPRRLQQQSGAGKPYLR